MIKEASKDGKIEFLFRGMIEETYSLSQSFDTIDI
jgi:hypothetical protein